MREIKFRAWDETYSRFVNVGDNYYLNSEGSFDTTSFADEKGLSLILMQFTGMKDQHDHDIYEGDILELQATYYDTRRDVVVYDLDMHGFMVDNRYLHDFGKYWSIEIIGNIYENPELLKK